MQSKGDDDQAVSKRNDEMGNRTQANSGCSAGGVLRHGEERAVSLSLQQIVIHFHSARNRDRCSFGVLCGLLHSVLTLGVAVHPVTAADSVPHSDRVERLVSKNVEPIIVHAPARDVADFGDSFDWAEQRRVHREAAALWKGMTEEEWEALIVLSVDKRYSVTVRATEHDDAANMSVGDQCSRLARARLTALFECHIRDRKMNAAISEKCGILGGDLVKWRNDRATSTLFQMQIECGQCAIAFLREKAILPDDEKARIIGRIEEDIATAMVSRRASIVEMSASWMDVYTTNPMYDAKTGTRKPR